METSMYMFTGCQIQEICLFLAITLLHKLQGRFRLIFTRQVGHAHILSKCARVGQELQVSSIILFLSSTCIFSFLLVIVY